MEINPQEEKIEDNNYETPLIVEGTTQSKNREENSNSGDSKKDQGEE